MIARLTGTVAERDDQRLTVDVHGVGYEVFCPRSTSMTLREGAEATLYVHTLVREDAFHLYGFGSKPEKAMFLLLTGVTGVGPKVALALLSDLPIAELAGAIARADVTALSRVSGVGKKTASRLALELKDKVLGLGVSPVMATASAGTPALPGAGMGDAVSALVNLGYSKARADKAIQTVLAEHPDMPLEGLIRLGLAQLAKG
ncbi:MAG: Holliday junction branch migration protein RuvA [Nitrospirota bacterium]|nr:Holliday junction branch migration protein RuvA [Nitrospirota bacterium]